MHSRITTDLLMLDCQRKHIVRTNALKRIDVLVHRELGINPALVLPWSNSTMHVRAGVKWGALEMKALEQRLYQEYLDKYDHRLGLRCFSELGWQHGRSGAAIWIQLQKMFPDTFWKHFTDDYETLTPNINHVNKRRYRRSTD